MNLITNLFWISQPQNWHPFSTHQFIWKLLIRVVFCLLSAFFALLLFLTITLFFHKSNRMQTKHNLVLPLRCALSLFHCSDKITGQMSAISVVMVMVSSYEGRGNRRFMFNSSPSSYMSSSSNLELSCNLLDVSKIFSLLLA